MYRKVAILSVVVLVVWCMLTAILWVTADGLYGTIAALWAQFLLTVGTIFALAAAWVIAGVTEYQRRKREFERAERFANPS